jgi:hypothetical protein
MAWSPSLPQEAAQHGDGSALRWSSGKRISEIEASDGTDKASGLKGLRAPVEDLICSRCGQNGQETEMVDGNSPVSGIKTLLTMGSPKPASLINTVFSEKANSVFIAALILGVTFIGVPLIGRYWLSIEPYQVNLVICLGVALILSAFGAQATLGIGGLILAGTSAIVIGLYQILENRRIDTWERLQKEYVKSTLSGIDRRKYDIKIKFNPSQYVLSASRSDAREYEFAVFKDNIDQTVGRILIAKKGSDSDSEDQSEIPIAEECFRAGLGTGQRLEWKYREKGENAEVWDQKNGVVIGRYQKEADREACPRLNLLLATPESLCDSRCVVY